MTSGQILEVLRRNSYDVAFSRKCPLAGVDKCVEIAGDHYNGTAAEVLEIAKFRKLPKLPDGLKRVEDLLAELGVTGGTRRGASAMGNIPGRFQYQDGEPVVDVRGFWYSARMTDDEIREKACRSHNAGCPKTGKPAATNPNGTVEDPVKFPKGYNQAPGSDPLAFTLAQGLNFTRGNVVKYVVRAGRKDPSTELQDLKKAAEYLRREIEFLESKASK